MNKTLKIATTAMLTAFSVVANIFTIPLTPTFSKVISFSILFSALAGIYLGVVPAVIVGYFGDLIAHFIHPFGAYNWFVGISCALIGLVFALVYKLKWHKLLKLLLASTICFLVCSCFFNTFGLWLQIIVGVDPGLIGLIEYFKMDPSGIKKSFWVYLTGRIPMQLINWAINVVIVATLQQTKALDRLFDKIMLNGARKSNRIERLSETAQAPHTDDQDLQKTENSVDDADERDG